MSNLCRPFEARFFGLGISAGEFSPPDHSGWTRLLTVAGGAAIATCAGYVFPVLPGRGLLLGEGTATVTVRARCDVRMLYLRPWPCAVPGPVAIDPFVDALIARVVVRGYLDPAVDSDRRLLAVICDECRGLQPALPDLTLRLPSDTRAFDSHSSERTRQRIFRRETGLSVAAWRRRYALLLAIARIAQGERVADCAYDTGYANPSAFVHACRREFGLTPLTLASRSRGRGDQNV